MYKSISITLIFVISLFALVPPDTTRSSLVIISEPDSAAIHIDDLYMGRTPATGHDFIAGKEYRINVRKEGYEDFDIRVRLNSGVEDTLYCTLVKIDYEKKARVKRNVLISVGITSGVAAVVGIIFLAIYAVPTGW